MLSQFYLFVCFVYLHNNQHCLTSLVDWVAWLNEAYHYCGILWFSVLLCMYMYIIYMYLCVMLLSISHLIHKDWNNPFHLGCQISVLKIKIWIYCSESISWIYFLWTEKFTGQNKILLVLGWRTGAHQEDCMILTVNIWKTCNGEADFYYTSKTPIRPEEELYTVNNRQNIYKERCLQTAKFYLKGLCCISLD